MSLPSNKKIRKERDYNTGHLAALNNEFCLGTRFFIGDDFLKFLQINPLKVGWIKIDVEGFELNVLKGFKDFLKITNAVLELEIDSKTMLENQNSIYDFIFYMRNNFYEAYLR